MKETKRDGWGPSTLLNHPVKVPVPPGNDPLVAPIYQNVKFQITEGLPYHEQFIYTRVSNPTLRQLELSLAEIQKTEDCLVLGSGIAAVSATLLALLEHGDHVIAFREMYRPSRVFIRDTLKRYGIDSTFKELTDLDTLEAAIVPGKTKLVHFESPSNPNLEIADVRRLAELCQKHGLYLTMDATFGGIHQHQGLGVDVLIHSLTKFVAGHGDVLAGSVAGKKSVVQKVRNFGSLIGATLDPHAAFLVLRGLKTYLLRYERQSQSALEVARFLEAHPMVSRVFYPGLEAHPGHALAKSQMRQMGGVVSFILREELGISARTFCHRTKLIHFSISLGSTESIICPTLDFFGEDLTPQERREIGISEHSLRLSVGLEEPRDLIEDLRGILDFPPRN